MAMLSEPTRLAKTEQRRLVSSFRAQPPAEVWHCSVASFTRLPLITCQIFSWETKFSILNFIQRRTIFIQVNGLTGVTRWSAYTHTFHAGLLTGEIKAFAYDSGDGTCKSSFELRPTKRSCRGLAVDGTGDRLWSVSKDKSIQ